MGEVTKCELCGEPMPQGEEMFKFHGYSGNCPKPPLPRLISGAEMIALERRRQIEVEGWTSEHDDEHSMAQMAIAGLSYASVAASQVRLRDGCIKEVLPIYWPFSPDWWKPANDPVRNLVKAGALIAAEIDRLQRNSK